MANKNEVILYCEKCERRYNESALVWYSSTNYKCSFCNASILFIECIGTTSKSEEEKEKEQK
jgi:hypothetical protein